MKQLIALVPQEESVAFDLSVLDYVLLGRAPHLRLLAQPGEDDLHIAIEALETTGLAALQDRAFPSLSGGERQLATIARALAQETAILLMDEPTSHLDLANRRRVFQVMRVLKGVGKTSSSRPTIRTRRPRWPTTPSCSGTAESWRPRRFGRRSPPGISPRPTAWTWR